jgi:hypothetical protein
VLNGGDWMKVDFVVAGAQKSGTTTLHMLLSQHPAVHMASVKGTHFFDTEHHFSNGSVDYSAYHSYFTPRVGQCIVGESTPIYSFWEPAVRRIWDYNRDMKVIMVLRNPIERAFSNWNMQKSKGIENHSFEEALIWRKRERTMPCRFKTAAFPTWPEGFTQSN